MAACSYSPFDTAQRPKEPLEGFRIGETGVGVEEVEFAIGMRLAKHGKELAPELAREDVHVDEEVLGPPRDPARAVFRQAAARHDHVHMRVMRHR